jgi:P-type conjugative transfer protein VirB9
VIRTLISRLLSARGVLLVLLSCHGVATAQVIQGTPIRGDTRLIQYAYDADNTYLVLAKPKAVTHLQFAPNEVIRSMAAGDTANWELTATKDRRNIFIKPKFDGDETSVTVITDQRVYQFVLRSTGEGKKWYQRVNWIYGSEMILPLPDADAAAAGQGEVKAVKAGVQSVNAPVAAGVNTPLGIQPDKLRFNYDVSGDAPFRPLVVFDDGRFTYYKLPGNVQELPALFAVIDGTEYSLVNFEVQGEYIVAQRLMPTAVLKLGRSEVRVSQPVKRTFLGLTVSD